MIKKAFKNCLAFDCPLHSRYNGKSPRPSVSLGKIGTTRDNRMTEKLPTQTAKRPVGSALLEVDTRTIPSLVLARLIEEVRNESQVPTQVYNRVHNRHNRGR